jgi:hypothetical protein
METYDGHGYEFTQDQSEADKRLLVRFFVKPVENPSRSAAEGRKIFEERVFIHINVPGDRNNIVIRQMTDYDRARFAGAFKNWEANQRGDMPLNGTLLDVWPLVTLGMVEEFRYYGIRTVEQLAELRDDVILKVPGWASLKSKAKTYLELAKAEAPLIAAAEVEARIKSELEMRDKTIADQAVQLAAMQAQITLLNEQPRKRV